MAKLSTSPSRFYLLASLACLLLMGAGVSAQAQIILDFENNPNHNSGAGYNDIGEYVVQDGFTISDTGPIFGGQHSVSPDGGLLGYNYTGSVAIFNGSTDGSDTLTQGNSQPFSVNSIDVANVLLQAYSPGGDIVTFTGQINGGGVVTKTFTLGAVNNLTTVTFDSSFSNLHSFTINQTAPYNQFDNIVINGLVGSAATPEPGSIALLAAMGVTGGAFAVRRKPRS